MKFIRNLDEIQKKKRINFRQISISRGGALAHCSGFGTCWTGLGDHSTRPKLWDTLPWRHGPREWPQRPVGCPSTLARGVGLLRFGPTRSPVLRISDSAILVKDGEGGPRAGLGRPGQTFLDKLMPRAVLCWLEPSTSGPGPGW
jgi:hypothetical protein